MKTQLKLPSLPQLPLPGVGGGGVEGGGLGRLSLMLMRGVTAGAGVAGGGIAAGGGSTGLLSGAGSGVAGVVVLFVGMVNLERGASAGETS